MENKEIRKKEKNWIKIIVELLFDLILMLK